MEFLECWVAPSLVTKILLRDTGFIINYLSSVHIKRHKEEKHTLTEYKGEEALPNNYSDHSPVLFHFLEYWKARVSSLTKPHCLRCQLSPSLAQLEGLQSDSVLYKGTAISHVLTSVCGWVEVGGKGGPCPHSVSLGSEAKGGSPSWLL